MTEDFSLLEDQLRALVPGSPSRGLERRVAEALRAPVAVSRRWWEVLGFHHPTAAFGWGVVMPAMAAAMAITLFHLAMVTPGPSDANNPPTNPTAKAAKARPAGTQRDDLRVGANDLSEVQDGAASNVVYATDDEGVVLAADRQPVHRVRYLSEDTLKWRNPRTGASIEVSYPREEVVLTPVSAQ